MRTATHAHCRFTESDMMTRNMGTSLRAMEYRDWMAYREFRLITAGIDMEKPMTRKGVVFDTVYSQERT